MNIFQTKRYWLWAVVCGLQVCGAWGAERPNVLIAISDDQSYPHCSAYGDPVVKTPAFDRVAKNGVLFRQAFVTSPGCSPSRASMLTGRYPWQIEHAGTHASEFPSKYGVFPDWLEQAGYAVGYTGKGWGPGNWKISGRTRNPAGPDFSKHNAQPPYKGISNKDYTANFAEFLKTRKPDQPFCFWYGAQEPHRGYEQGSGLKSGKSLDKVQVPSFLPDSPEVRGDMLDYFVEIEWFDKHLGQMLDMLQAAGELENTIVIVTADNGMSFPRAKANCYEAGIHVPLAISWGKHAPAGRTVDDLTSMVDIAPTLLEACEVKHTAEHPLSGRSLVNVLKSEKQGQVDPARQAIYAGRERHSSSRDDNLAYPQRCIRTNQYLYIRNFRPDRWPAGAPQKFNDNNQLGPVHGGYHDIDACPTLMFLIQHRADPAVSRFFHWSVDKRPEEELFDLTQDPSNLSNLATDPNMKATLAGLRTQLEGQLRQTADPRILDGGDIIETYKRYSPVRKFPPNDPQVRTAPE